jgi:hypothetical protein
MWVYWLYGGVDDYGEQYIRKWLHEKYPWMTQEKALSIIQSFEESHPARPPEDLNIDLLDFEWIEHFHPKGYILPIPFYQLEAVYPEFKITKTKEKEIINIVIKNNDQASKNILKWFNKNKKDNYEAWTRKDVQAMAVSTAIQYGAPLEKYGYGIDLDDETEVKSEVNLDANLEAKAEVKLPKKKVEVVENYMSFQLIDAKIKLLAKNGFWNFTVAKNKYNFSISQERFFAYMVFSNGDISGVSRNLRMLNRNMSPAEIEDFVQYFKDTHPLIKETFQLEMIAPWANEKRPLEILNPFSFSIQLSKEQENELIEIILSDEKNRFDTLKIWFGRYLLKYGFEPKHKDKEWVEQELAIQFCIQHGICYGILEKPKSKTSLYSFDPIIIKKREAKIAEKQKYNYMIFQDMDAKIELLAKNGFWNFTVSEKEYSLSASSERLLAYMILKDKDIDCVSSDLRAWDEDITSAEIKDFVRYFEDTHPLIEENFQLESIPLYADEKHPLEISNPLLSIQLSQEQEELLIRIATSNGKKQFERLKMWFSQYRNKHGFDLRYEQYQDSFDKEAAIHFCMQHGINWKKVGSRRNKHEEAIHQDEIEKLVVVLIVLVLFIICGWLAWALFLNVFF